MNKNLNLTKILKDCPIGTKLYSTIYGYVFFKGISTTNKDYPIVYHTSSDVECVVSSDGRRLYEYNGECTLFPSKDQRDWSKWAFERLIDAYEEPPKLKIFDKEIAKQNEDLYKMNKELRILNRQQNQELANLRQQLENSINEGNRNAQEALRISMELEAARERIKALEEDAAKSENINLK